MAEELARAGIDIDAVTDQLLEEGVDQFSQSFDQLIAGIEARAGMIECGFWIIVEACLPARHRGGWAS